MSAMETSREQPRIKNVITKKRVQCCFEFVYLRDIRLNEKKDKRAGPFEPGQVRVLQNTTVAFWGGKMSSLTAIAIGDVGSADF
jgi:hypothetical protein